MKKFLSDRSGNFAMMTAVLIVPLLAGAGMAIDYAGATMHKQKLQDALDSAALAIGRKVGAVTQPEAEVIAGKFLAENFTNLYRDLDVQIGATSVRVTATVDYPVAFAGIFGKDKVELTRSSATQITRTTTEIALVLDTTGSMEGGKMTAMKDAVTSMIDDMSARNTTPGALKFSLVPFSTFVNVGSEFGPTFNPVGKQKNDGADWLDLNGDSPVGNIEFPAGISRFQIAHHLGEDWEGCVETRMDNGSMAYSTDDLSPVASDPYSLFVPAVNIDEPDDVSKYPNSYIDSNADPLDNSTNGLTKKMNKYGIPTDAAGKPIAFGTWSNPTVKNNISWFYSNYNPPVGPNYSCASRSLTPLTDNYVKLKSEVNALAAKGSTNILEGLMWGWRTLSSRPPFTDGRPELMSGNNKILVLLSDGANSFGNLNNDLGSAYTSFGYLSEGRLGPVNMNATQTQAALDAKTGAGCQNAKRDGIEIYTILLEVDDAATSALMKACATDDSHYFKLENRNQLKSTFDKIRDNITNVRLTG